MKRNPMLTQSAPGTNQPAYFNLPRPPTPPPGFPAFDPANPMATFALMQSMMSQVGQQPNTQPSNRGFKMRCPDYDQAGFCTLGNNCLLEHSDTQLHAPPSDAFKPKSTTFQNTYGQETIQGQQKSRESSQRHSYPFNHQMSNTGFGNEGPAEDPNIKSIVVEQIPDAFFNELTIRKFFSQFGQIQKIDMRPAQQLAVIAFQTKAGAYKAWSSPQPVFNNRFVKVYWYRPDSESQEQSKGYQFENSAEVDYKAFLQTLEEKQKAHDQRRAAKAATDQARQEIIARREAMAKDLDELLTKLAIAEGREHTKTQEPSKGRPSAKVQALREQLRRMQAEARSLGIDLKSPANPTSYNLRQPSWSPRGRSVSQSRYGGFPSSAYRSPAPFGSGYRTTSHKLDNRPKTIAISGVEFDSITEEKLQAYLAQSGPFEAIEPNPARDDSRLVHFAERWQAETIIFGGRVIPGVGHVELAWVGPVAEEAGKMVQQQSQEVGVRGGGPNRPDDLDVAGGDYGWAIEQILTRHEDRVENEKN